MTAREQPADSAWTAPRSVVSQRRFLIFLIVVTAVFALTMSPFVRCDMVTIMNSADALAASGFRSDIVHGGLPHLVVPAGSGFISIYPKALEYAFGLLFLLLDTTSRLTIVVLIVAAAAAVIWLRVAAANRLLAMTVPGIFLAVTGLILNFGDGHGGLMAAMHMAVALLCASLVYRLAETMTPRDRSPFMSVAYGLVFGSILLFAARCYYRDVYYVTAVLGAAYFTIRRNLPWLYACYFLGVLVKYEHVVIALPALALFSWLEWRAGVVAFRSVLRHGLILGGLTAAALSLHFFLLFLAVGMDPALMRAVTLRFGSSLAAPSFTTIYALLVSPGKGMLLFCPLTVLLLFVRFERIEAPREVTLLATLSLTYFLFAASLFFWSGDYAWGPRLVLLPMLLSGGILAQAAPQFGRRSVQALAILGILVNAPSGLLSFSNWIDYEMQVRSPIAAGDTQYYFRPAGPIADTVLQDENRRYDLTVPRANLIFLPFESPVFLGYQLLWWHVSHEDGRTNPTLRSDALALILLDALRTAPHRN